MENGKYRKMLKEKGKTDKMAFFYGKLVNYVSNKECNKIRNFTLFV